VGGLLAGWLGGWWVSAGWWALAGLVAGWVAGWWVAAGRLGGWVLGVGWLGDWLVGFGWVRGWVAVSTEKAGGAALVKIFGCISRAQKKPPS